MSAPGLVLITSAKRNTLYMKCILFKWVLCLLLGFSSVSYSREFTIDFSTQQSYVSSLNSIRTEISTPLEHIS
ncbi:Shiga toxin subunit A, partial [Escherichia coli]